MGNHYPHLFTPNFQLIPMRMIIESVVTVCLLIGTLIKTGIADEDFLEVREGFATSAIHAGQDPEKWNSSAVVPPIVTSTVFKMHAPDAHSEFVYSRYGNPTRNTLEECLAALDGGEHALTFASGLGAISTIASLLSSGDHLISSDDFYAGTNGLFRNVLARMGVSLSFIDFTKLCDLDDEIRENTKMIWIETPTNPLMKVVDLEAVVKIVKRKGNILVVVDNTFLTPYLQRPLDFGVDIVAYSLTKYMNGHSDVTMGAAVVNDKELGKKLRRLQATIGAVPSPFDCYLVNRSLKTLALRMEQHKKSSLLIAKWLERHPNVVEVLHTGLSSHPQRHISKQQTCGHSGVFSFRHSGGLTESRIFLSSLRIFILAGSLGGYESLAELPSLMSHSSVPKDLLAAHGITDSLIRVSVGLEDVDDLIHDLDQALKNTFRKPSIP